MGIFDNFEKKFLFGLTRIFAMLVILSILIAIGIGGVLFGGFYNQTNSKVAITEVIDAIKPPITYNDSATTDSNSSTQLKENINALPSVKMPFVLQKHFNSPEKVKVLKGWLNILSLEKHQEFIDEMSATVTEAEKLKLSSTEAIDKYKELKFKKIETEMATKAERKTQQLYYAGAVVGAVALIALFSLILVLLAIERNTRRVER
jgi:hypothetical protein